jgi:hypothetical protein
MVQNLYQFISPDSISSTDSLKQSISFLNARIDSLSKHTQINEIGQNFFSDAISRDLYMFSTMIVIVGLVSWAFIAGVMARHKRNVEKKMDFNLKVFKTETQAILDDIEYKRKIMVYDINRAMYFSVLDQHDLRFNWSIGVVDSILDIGDIEGDMEIITNWLEISSEHLSHVTVRTNTITNASETVMHTIARLFDVDYKALTILALKLREDYYHLIYSKNTNQTDLFEDAIEEVP